MEKTSLTVIRNLIRSIKNWIKENPKEFGFLIFILLIASFLRLYRIGDYMTFLGMREEMLL